MPMNIQANNYVNKQRDSNIELLRIVAMLMILTLHTRFEGIEAMYDGIIDANHLCRFSFQALSIIGVFFGSGKSTEVATVYHTFIGTCQMLGISALKYFKMFFSAIAEGRRDYENLLPQTIGIINNR